MFLLHNSCYCGHSRCVVVVVAVVAVVVVAVAVVLTCSYLFLAVTG
jgi:hypothetical protein